MKIYKNDNGYSMSPAAQRAYENGELPISKLTKNVLRNTGIKESLSFIKWLIKYKFIRPSSQHHTSKYINLTAFYSLEDIKNYLDNLSPERFHDLKIQYENRNDEFWYLRTPEYQAVLSDYERSLVNAFLDKRK